MVFLQPWGLKISVYLPRQSLRYLLDLTVRQVAAVIEDARLEQWEKDMLDHDKVFKVSVCASARWCGVFAVAVVSSRFAFVPPPAETTCLGSLLYQTELDSAAAFPLVVDLIP